MVTLELMVIERERTGMGFHPTSRPRQIIYSSNLPGKSCGKL